MIVTPLIKVDVEFGAVESSMYATNFRMISSLIWCDEYKECMHKNVTHLVNWRMKSLIPILGDSSKLVCDILMISQIHCCAVQCSCKVHYLIMSTNNKLVIFLPRSRDLDLIYL